MTKQELIISIINNKRMDRSAWKRGVKAYALELLEDIEVNDIAEITKEVLLNGASSWSDFSWGGCSLCYDYDIALRLCNPSELKKVKGGDRRPNSREEWLDTQARALNQAYNLIMMDVISARRAN